MYKLKNKIRKWLNVLDTIPKHITTLLAKNGINFLHSILLLGAANPYKSSVCWWKVNGCILICWNFLCVTVLHWRASKSYSVACRSESCFLSQNLGLAVANNCFTLKIESPSPTPASKNADGSTRRSAGCRLVTDPACVTESLTAYVAARVKCIASFLSQVLYRHTSCQQKIKSSAEMAFILLTETHCQKEKLEPTNKIT